LGRIGAWEAIPDRVFCATQGAPVRPDAGAPYPAFPPQLPPRSPCDDCLVSHYWQGRKRRMGNPAIGVLYALAMVAVVVGLDLLFFRHKTWFWERLAANVGIVLLFGAFYFRFAGSA